MGRVSLTFRIEEEDKRKIEEIARSEDRSISYIVNLAIKRYLRDQSETQNQGQEEDNKTLET